MWTITRACLAVLLLCTAALKWANIPTLIGAGGFLSNSAMLSSVVAVEAFAAVIIAGAPALAAHIFATLVFTTLASVAAWAFWTQTDCGCFGSQTPRGAPLLIDLGCLTLLAVSGQSARRAVGPPHSGRAIRLVLSAATLSGVVAGGVTYHRTASLTRPSEMPAFFGENLLGERVPLLADDRFEPHIPENGDVLIVLLRPDCNHCRDVAAAWPVLAPGFPKDLGVIGVSVSDDDWTVMPDVVATQPISTTSGFMLEWNEIGEPFIAAPMLIAIRNRIVVGAKSGNDATELLEQERWVSELFEPVNHAMQ